MLNKIGLKSVLIVSFLMAGLFIQPMQSWADDQPVILNVVKPATDRPHPQQKGPAHSSQPVDQGRHQNDHRQDNRRPEVPKGFAYHMYLKQARDWDIHSNYTYVPPVDIEPVMINSPAGLTAVNVNGQIFFYSSSTGAYYQQGPGGFLPVPAPVGAVVSTIPVDCSVQYSNGTNYHICNGVDYTWSVDGYRVVGSSDSTDQVASVVTYPNAPVDSSSQGSFTVNIPRADGNGYVPVILTRSGNGFVGPQGEFYVQFPTVSLLGVMYGG